MGKLSSRTARLAVTAGLAATLAVSGLPVAAFAEGATTNKPAAEASADVATTSVAPTETAEDGADKADASKDNATTEATADAVETPAADSAAPAADAAEAADPKAASETKAYSVGGTAYSTFEEALNAAGENGTITLVANSSEKLTVNKKVTITADAGVTFTGTLTITADGVTVDGVHFNRGAAAEGRKDSILVSGATGTTVKKCYFTAPSELFKGVEWQYNGIALEGVTKTTTIEDNTFNLGRMNDTNGSGDVAADSNANSAINLVGGGGGNIDGVVIQRNTVTVTAPAGDATRSASVNLLIANGNNNEPDTTTFGIKNVTVADNTYNGAADKDNEKTRFAGISNVKGISFTENKVSNAGTGIGQSVWKDQTGGNNTVTYKKNEFTGVKTPVRQPYASASVSASDGTVALYTSVNEAINASNDPKAVVQLTKDVTEDVVIPAGKTVTLDLAGKKLTNAAGHTITNHGTLTVTDSSDGKTGVVDNVSHGKAALSNEEGATATLNGGTFKRSKEDSTNGSNTFYTILNHGTMTINDPTKVESKNVNGSLSTFSSLIDNGWYSGSPNKDNAKLTINGGTFEGGNYIKNDSYGELTINGGSVKGSSAAVFSWNKATINGGEFSSEGNQVIWNGGGSVDKDPEGANVGQLTITGGTFTATDGQTIIAQHAKNLTDGQKNDVAVKVTGGTFKGALADDLVNAQISGGSFTVAPDASYIVAGSGLDKRDDGTYGVTKAVLVLDGSVQDGTLTVDVAKGAALTKADLLKLASVSAEGYTLDVSGDFDGLAAAIKDKDTSKSFEFTYTATKDGKNADTLTAKLAVKLTDSSVVTKPDATKTWKVTFVDGIDSTDDPTVEVKDGEAVAKPADPTLDGWKFVGWYTTLNDDGTVENEYDFSQPVKGDLTLYAGWVPAGSSDGTKPEEPKSDNKGNKELPQTGDTTNYAIPVALGVAGVVAVGGALVMRKRQQ